MAGRELIGHFKDFLDEDDLRSFVQGELRACDVLLDDPIDFINGFSSALTYMVRSQFRDSEDKMSFRISVAIWLRRLIDEYEISF